MRRSTHSGKAFLLLLLMLVMACRNPDQPVASAAEPGRDAGEGPREGIEGMVTSADGKPLAGVFVQAESLDEPAVRIPELAVFTGEDGRYLWPLSPGRYRLSASLEGREPATGTATVEAGRRTTLDLTLQ